MSNKAKMVKAYDNGFIHIWNKSKMAFEMRVNICHFLKVVAYHSISDRNSQFFLANYSS